MPFCACHSTKNDLTVTYKNFEGEIQQQQNLVFTFNKDIYPDSLLQTWDSTAYIEFSPAVKGMFKWNSSSELMFSPSEGFQPGAEYTATITPLVMKKSSTTYSLDDKTLFHFHTASLRIVNTHLSWVRAKNVANASVQLDVDYNYEVKLNDAAQHLKLSENNNPLSMVTLASRGVGKTVSLQFMPVNIADKDEPLTIAMSKGIPVNHSKYISKEDTTINALIPSRYKPAITGVTAQHNGSEGTITINTSEPVAEDSLKSMITLEPYMPFTVSINDADFTIVSNKLSPEQTYQLTISANLSGAFGGKMKSDYNAPVSFGKLQPVISFY